MPVDGEILGSRIVMYHKDVLRRAFLTTTASTLLAACASPIPKDAPRFSRVEEPLPGYARLYVFRPPFESYLKREAPMLVIGQKEAAPIAHESFTSISLTPGNHTLSLRPGTTELAKWNKTIQLSAETGKTYFLAIWMNIGTERGVSFIPVPGALVPIQGTSVRAQGVLHEFVTAEQAIDSLHGLAYLPPMQATY